MTGLIVVALMLSSASVTGWHAFCLVSTIVGRVTGYFPASASELPYLHRFAPDGIGLAFVAKQLIVFIAFMLLAIRRYRSLLFLLLAAGGLFTFAAQPASAQDGAVDRLYVIDCGHNDALDQSRWSPGVNVGKPIELSDNCYLIRHGSDWLLWDTGYPDAVADKPLTNALGTATRAKKLAAALAELGVKPDDIKYVAVSHTHGDHVGNVDLFPTATLLIQKPEVDWAFAAGKTQPFKADRPMKLLAGDLDVFGDGSVTIVSTPGHTPGHQSLLVHLPKTGWILLSGDAAHFKDNWDNRRVASMNTSAEQTQASYARIAQLLADRKAELWINHDAAQSRLQKHSPQYYD
jgi:glyoxylase-like metal-dependent hydrolase (beta-lactamase superfamily II)